MLFKLSRDSTLQGLASVILILFTFTIFLNFLSCFWTKLGSATKRNVLFRLRSTVMGPNHFISIFLLVPLKSTLTRLSLSTNPDIDNDAVPALLLLHRLSVLSLLDTAIDMEGFRRIAEVVHRDHRVVRIKFPFTCEYYIKSEF